MCVCVIAGVPDHGPHAAVESNHFRPEPEFTEFTFGNWKLSVTVVAW